MDVRRHFEKILLEMAAQRPASELLWATSTSSPSFERDRSPLAHKHVTDGHEFNFVTRGCVRVTVGGDIIHLTPGRLLLVGRNVAEQDSPVDGQPFLMNWCYTDHSFALLGQTSFLPPATWKRGPSVNLLGRTDVESIAAAILGELEQKEWQWERSAHALLDYLCCILVRRLRRGSAVHFSVTEPPAIHADPHTWRVVRSALRFCDANFRRPLRLADVAAAVGYSPSHLSRLVSTHLGRSLSEYLRQLRIQDSKRMLESTDMTITEIARSLGYRDPSHFSHSFTRATGMSPKAYRDRLRNL
jgi:AraC-like DNA-binding protein